MRIGSEKPARISDIIRSRHHQIVALWLKEASLAASARIVDETIMRSYRNDRMLSIVLSAIASEFAPMRRI